ncbi:MAG: hypothetical protein ACPH3I_02385 [Porticoccaceae bacterium]
MTAQKKSRVTSKDDHDYFDQLLDDLYLLQEKLLYSEIQNADDTGQHSPEIATDSDALNIPILTQTLNREIDNEHQSRQQFDEAQQHLFEQPDTQPNINEEQVTAIVNRLMSKLRPKVEQLLRQKIRSKVIERFNREN